MLARSTATILPGDGAAKATRSGRLVLFVNTEVKKFSPVNASFEARREPAEEAGVVAVTHAGIHIDRFIGKHHGAGFTDHRLPWRQRDFNELKIGALDAVCQ